MVRSRATFGVLDKPSACCYRESAQRAKRVSFRNHTAGACRALLRHTNKDFPPGFGCGIIAAMDANSRQGIQEGLLTDLVSARPDLVEIHANALRKLIEARSTLGIVFIAGFGPDAVCQMGGEGTPLTLAQLSDRIKQFESEEAQVCALIAQIDARGVRGASIRPDALRSRFLAALSWRCTGWVLLDNTDSCCTLRTPAEELLGTEREYQGENKGAESE
jgi:hypothetical protein